ncbi:hypothetical protein PIB30_078511 [Stylosanthes scabra]|uniref:Uncharacterized protein n=1 Tax=Stylosanthes scabra TaxID=79078 RepID=A0ABU6YP41_9FABA|nr:hypothetical protein [Stylosanthes scabra]
MDRIGRCQICGRDECPITLFLSWAMPNKAITLPEPDPFPIPIEATIASSLLVTLHRCRCLPAVSWSKEASSSVMSETAEPVALLKRSRSTLSTMFQRRRRLKNLLKTVFLFTDLSVGVVLQVHPPPFLEELKYISCVRVEGKLYLSRPNTSSPLL